MSSQALEIPRGDGRTFTITPSEDVIGASSLIFTAKTSKRLSDDEATFQHSLGAGVIVADGNIVVSVVSLDTDELPECVLVWDVQAQWPGTDPRTVAEGTLKVRADVTRGIDTSIPIHTTGPSATQSAIDAADRAEAAADSIERDQPNGVAPLDGDGLVPLANLPDMPVSPDQQATLDLKAPLASPALTGSPTAPTPGTLDDSTKLATTAFVKAVIAQVINGSPSALDTLAELAAALGSDPNFATTITTLVGTKLAKSANLSDLTNVATALVNLGLNNVNNTSDANKPVSTAQQAALDLKANLASPALTGTPTVPTAAPGTNTTQAASTAFVAAAIAALVNSSPAALDTLNELAAALGNDASFATTVTNALALKAPLASPAFTGTPTAPTAAAGTATTQLATTAFVKAADDLLAPARAPRPGLISAGTSPVGTTQDNTGLAFGTSDLTIGMWVRLPDWTPAAQIYLLGKYTASLGLRLAITTNGLVQVRLGTGVSGDTAYNSSVAPGVSDGAWAFVVARLDRDGNWQPYVNGAGLGSAISIASQSAQTLTTTAALSWLSDGATHTVGTIGESWIINGLLSASRIADIYRAGSIAPFCAYTPNTTTGRDIATIDGLSFFTWPDFGRADPQNNPIAWDRSGNNQHAILGTSGLTAAVPLTWRNTAPDRALVSDGSNGTRVYATLNDQNPGTGECVLLWEGSDMVAATGSSIEPLAALTSSATDTIQAHSLHLWDVGATGLIVRLYGATTSDYRSLASVTLQSWVNSLTARGIACAVVVLRDSSGLRVFFGIGRDAARYYDATNFFTESATSSAPPAWTDEIDGDYIVGFYRNSITSSAHTLSRLALANVAMTEAQLRAEYERGEPGPEWLGASNTAVNTVAASNGTSTRALSSFSASGTSGFSGESATSTTVRYAGWSVLVVRGQRLRVAYDYAISSGSPTNSKLALRQSASDGTAVSNEVDLVASTGQSAELVATASGTVFLVFGWSGDGSVATVASVANVAITKLGITARLRPDTAAGSQAKNGAASDTNDSTHFELSTSGLTRSPSAQIGERQTITKTYAHSDISSTAGTTAHGSLPPGWVVREIQRNRATAFDTGITLDIGISGTSGKFASALAADSTGFAQSASASLVPESASASTTIYIKKSGATTQGATTITLVIERVF